MLTAAPTKIFPWGKVDFGEIAFAILPKDG